MLTMTMWVAMWAVVSATATTVPTLMVPVKNGLTATNRLLWVLTSSKDLIWMPMDAITPDSTLTGTINIGTVVAVAKTTLDIATHKVVKGITQIGVNPLAEVGLSQLIG